MKRSVRNGIAIAGMAGGMWLLGQAVASADEVATTGADTAVTQTDGGGGGNSNSSSNDASSENVQVTKVETDVSGGNGGENQAAINTGVLPGGMPSNTDEMLSAASKPSEHHDDKGTTVTLNTGDVHATQQANGGDVSNSGNVAVAGGGNQTATANATTTVDQTSTGGDDHHGRDHHDHDGPSTLGPQNGHDEGGNANESENNASSENKDITKVETDVQGGNGGYNSAEINTGIIGNFYCEKGGCTYNITTGSVWLDQQANGGNVNNSGNVGVGAPVPGSTPPCTCAKPEEHKAAAPAAAAPVKAAPVAHRAVVLSSAQPSGQLAFTGAETTLPLTLGLLALGVGGALTLAGRRRETATV